MPYAAGYLIDQSWMNYGAGNVISYSFLDEFPLTDYPEVSFTSTVWKNKYQTAMALP